MPNAFDFFTISNIRRYTRILLFLGKWLMRLLSASVEAYLRFNFGRRYVLMLLGAFCFMAVCSDYNSGPAMLTNLFLLGLAVQVIRHFIYVFRRRRLAIAEPHSASAGVSWKYWQRLGFAPATVQQYFEPMVCGTAGWIISMADPFLGCWLMASAVALFVKEQMNRWRMTNRIIESLDAKLEAQRLNTSLTQFKQKPGQGAQKSHRAHFPRRSQHAPP